MTAKTGADYISPFLGRIEDIGHDGVGLIEDIADIYSAARLYDIYSYNLIPFIANVSAT